MNPEARLLPPFGKEIIVHSNRCCQNLAGYQIRRGKVRQQKGKKKKIEQHTRRRKREESLCA